MQYSNFRKFIRYKRESLPISLNKFALGSGIKPATLSNFENGKSDILFETLVKISTGFGVSLSELFIEFDNYEKKDN